MCVGCEASAGLHPARPCLQPDELMFVARLHSHGGLLEFLATFESMASFDTQTSVVSCGRAGARARLL